MARSKLIKEWLEVMVTAANATFKESFEVDKHAEVILGIDISSNFDNLLFYRGSQRITINDMEIFPEGYESKMLLQGLNVSVNERIIKLGEDILPGNRVVSFEYKDQDHPATVFQPYRVRLYVFSKLQD